MDAGKRKEIEREIADAFLTAVLAAGHKVNIDNGGDEYVFKHATANKNLALNEMFAADEERVFVYDKDTGKCFGWVQFVYGNGGWDVMSDNTTSMEPFLVEASRLSEVYSNPEV